MEVLRIKNLKYDRYFLCPDNYPRGNMPSGRLSPGLLPPKWLPPHRIIAPGQLHLRISAPNENFSPDYWPPPAITLEENWPPGNCPRGKLLPGKLPTHYKISLENNCPHSRKSPSASTMRELRQTIHCLRVL